MKLRTVSLIIILLGLVLARPLQAQQPIVQAILFYSPSCPHCHDVIDNVLPPLKAQYGESLQLVGVDTSKASGQQLFTTAYEKYADPGVSSGVPALLVGERYLVGSAQIPAEFPGLIESGLAAGGTPWPDLPGLRQAIPDLPPDAGTLPATETETESMAATPNEAVMADALAGEAAAPVSSSGMALAWAVLIGMGLALAFAAWRILGMRGGEFARAANTQGLTGWLIPLLALAGLGVALYLAHIEVTHSTAVCGPVGDCNAVQTSEYATLFGIPIAVLGILNYVGILGLWLLLHVSAPKPKPSVAAALVLLTVAGTLFSIYLTALEIFVIEAVCAWCLSSAIITTALMLISVTALFPRTGNSRRATLQAQ